MTAEIVRLVHDRGKMARAVADSLRDEAENIIADTGEKLIGYAVVGWTIDGLMRSALYLEAGSPITLLNVPTKVREHLAKRVHDAD